MNQKLLLQYKSINRQITKLQSQSDLNNLQKHYLNILLNLKQQILNWVENIPKNYQSSLKDFVINGKSKFYCARFYDLDISVFENCQHYLSVKENIDEKNNFNSSIIIN